MAATAKRKTSWHFWIIAAAIAAGLLAVFWPDSLTNSPQEISGDNYSDENAVGLASSAGDATRTENAGPKDEGLTETDTAGQGALLNQQAINAWYGGQVREAMSLFEQAIDAAPNDPAPHSNYGRLLTLMTSYERALPLLERARDLTPDDAQVWLDLATLYERVQILEKSWEARAKAGNLVGADAITRDEQGRFVLQGTTL
jgi:predicted Zn-dependent protease